MSSRRSAETLATALTRAGNATTAAGGGELGLTRRTLRNSQSFV